jgi:MFS family permease
LKDYSRIARKIIVTLFLTHSLGSAAFIVIGSISAIVGAQLSGYQAWAGVPSASLQLGAAFAALIIGALITRTGWRWGVALGLAVGVLGAGLAASAIVKHSFLLFLGGVALIGVAWAAMRLSRFAAAEVNPPDQRGRAISYVVIGGTVGAVLGPLLVGPSGQMALQRGVNELVGPYWAAMIILSLATLLVTIGLRPDPRDVGKIVAEEHPESVSYQGPARPVAQILRTPGAIMAVSAMVVGQLVMVMLMSITSLYMRNNQHTLTDISLVISAHTFGMYAFSIISGRLTDRWGRGKVIISGSVTLVLASILAPLSTEVWFLSIALFLLGLGWNFCYVGGSALLTDQLSPAERSKTQGVNDLLLGLATAIGSLLSGLMFANLGYTSIGTLGVMITFGLMGITGWWMMRGQRLATA